MKSRRKFGASRYPPGSRKRVNPENFQYLVRNSTRLDRYLPSHKPAYDRTTKKAAVRKGRNIHRPFAAQCRTLTTTMDAIMSASGQETCIPAPPQFRSFYEETSSRLVASSRDRLSKFAELVLAKRMYTRNMRNF